MRSSLLSSVALACAALFATCGAKAVPIHVGLMDAVGSHSWTSPLIGDPHGTLSLSAWEYDNGMWTAALLDAAPGYNGLGVACNPVPQPVNNTCLAGQISSVPWQTIDIGIGGLTGWNGLTVKIDSVDAGETAYLLGAACTVGGGCTPSTLTLCTNQGSSETDCSFFLSRAALFNITDIWVTPSATNPNGVNRGNIVLDADFTLQAVPEPAELGIFGFGLLLVGVMVGLRRRRTD